MDTSPDPSASAFPKRASQVRFYILFGLALASAHAYLPRVCLGIAATTIRKEFDFSGALMGDILAVFFLGYFLFQVPGGWMEKRWGCRRVLPILCVLWSACSAATGLAASALAFRASRFMLGVTQAGLVPVSSKAVRDWFPQHQRGVASSMIATAMSLGSVIATGLTGLLMPWLGWRGVFFIYAVLGVMWSFGFYLYFRDRPRDHPQVNAGEVALIEGVPVALATAISEAPPAEAAESAEPEEDSRSVTLAMATSPSLWLLCIQAFFRAYGAVFFITWLPTYLEKGRGVTVLEAASMTMAPLIGTVLGNIAGGIAVDRLLQKTGSKRISRSVTSALALVGAAVMIWMATLVPNALACSLCLAVGSFSAGCGSAAAWACGMDISGKHTSVIMGLQNMGGNIGAYICPKIVGNLVDWIEAGNGSYDVVLYMFVAIYLAGALAWAGLDPNRSAVTRSSAPLR